MPEQCKAEGAIGAEIRRGVIRLPPNSFSTSTKPAPTSLSVAAKKERDLFQPQSSPSLTLTSTVLSFHYSTNQLSTTFGARWQYLCRSIYLATDPLLFACIEIALKVFLSVCLSNSLRPTTNFLVFSLTDLSSFREPHTHVHSSSWPQKNSVSCPKSSRSPPCS